MLVSAGTRLPPDGTPEVFELKKKKGGGGKSRRGNRKRDFNFELFIFCACVFKRKKKTLSWKTNRTEAVTIRRLWNGTKKKTTGKRHQWSDT